MKLKQVQYNCNYIVLVLISLLFYFISSLRRGDQSTVFCIVSFDFDWSRSPKIRQPFALVCRCGLADIRRFIMCMYVLESPAKKMNYSGTCEICLMSVKRKLFSKTALYNWVLREGMGILTTVLTHAPERFRWIFQFREGGVTHQIAPRSCMLRVLNKCTSICVYLVIRYYKL